MTAVGMYSNQVMIGDCMEIMQNLINDGVVVHTCVTSPPYYGLRDYGVDGQIGLESNPQEYIDKMVEVFRLVRQLLRDDGTLWLVLGDSYAGSGINDGRTNPGLSKGYKREAWKDSQKAPSTRSHGLMPTGLKSKDLMGIPWRIALALQENGWWLRSDIIWHKPNPMPESVRDRPTRAHEYVFLLSKSQRYFYDHYAIREPAKYPSQEIAKIPAGWNTSPGRHDTLQGRYRTDKQRGHSKRHAGFNERWDNMTKAEQMSLGSNKRSVWSVSTVPFKGAHFATYPPKLIEPCIKAGTSEQGCCCECGAPWKRIVKKGKPNKEWKAACGADSQGEYKGKATKSYEGTGAENPSDVKARILEGLRDTSTVGWEPTCKCGHQSTVPCVVLDPFAGTGTTGEVAERLGRHWIMIELNPANLTFIEERTAQQGLGI